MRNSLTHPLYIDSFPLANGDVGLTLCPGKQEKSIFGWRWERDLDLDVQMIANWGAKAVVTLIEPAEIKRLGVTNLPEVIKSKRMMWFHLPIPDCGVPDTATLEAWRAHSPQLHALLESGAKILIHCRAGLGRAGTIAALLLTERGETPDQALGIVRAARKGAIESKMQADWLAAQALPNDGAARQVHASLLAGAMGDSLGSNIEFLSLFSIRRRFPDGINDIPVHNRLRGAITDDTQMTLFTAEGLVRAAASGTRTQRPHPKIFVHQALLRWFVTQGYETKIGEKSDGLMTDARLAASRAPGNTCLSSLMRAQHFGKAAKNNSKGCGAIMRVAPVAFWAERAQVRELAIETSALTHGHPTGQLAAAAWAEMLADVAHGANLETSARKLARSYGAHRDGQETVAAINAALAAKRDGRAETVETLGSGWTGEEALAIALHCCLTADNLEQGLLMAVTHGGDSDSTGAIAGNMLGLLYPDQVRAHRWAHQVECVDLITRLSRDLCTPFDPQKAKGHWSA